MTFGRRTSDEEKAVFTVTHVIGLVLFQDLARILQRAAKEGGYVDPSTVESILGVSQDDVLPEGPPTKRCKLEGTILLPKKICLYDN